MLLKNQYNIKISMIFTYLKNN